MSVSQSIQQYIERVSDKLKLNSDQQQAIRDGIRQGIDIYKQRSNSNKMYHILPVLALYIAYRAYKYTFPVPNVNPSGKSVVISGCDTGFGHGVAVQLDKLGFTVFAGVYAPDSQGAKQLKQKLSNRSHIVKLDITKQIDIDNLVNYVKQHTNSVYALINNAGIGAGGLIDWIDMNHVRTVMEVNFFGHVAMTKSFLPLITASPGNRVINLCSVAGYLASVGMMAYSSSKFAMEAFSDSLRREMLMWDIKVSIIEPGFMKTPIVEGHSDKLLQLWNGLDSTTRRRYGEGFGEELVQAHTKGDVLLKHAEDPILVVNDIVHAVQSTSPKIRYRPGWQSSRLLFPISMLPAWYVI